MALTITQTPPKVNLAQSPIAITLSESSGVLASSSFQYVCDLYYWSGALTNSGSAANYTLVKYPNESYVGIFDVSRILNSTLTDLLQANSSNVKYFAVDGYWQYFNGIGYTTGSHVKTETYKYIDGYGLFQEPISQSIQDKTPHWPLMTDGPSTQSVFEFNMGVSGVYGGEYGGGVTPTKVLYASNLGVSADYTITPTTSTSGQIIQYPVGPSQSGFPLSKVGLEYYTIQAYNGSSPIGTPIKYELTCNQKYPNIRIKWKNRYGQFDYFNFNMVNRQTFNVNRSVYQPQIGSWGGSTLTYNNYDSNNLNYLVDTTESISVNSNWVSEDYNDIFKQLLVSDEMYWIYDESTNDLRPITISTNSVTFKTGVVDKVIQYAFDFNYGQTYKLII
jgi:hypothetical protein